MIIKLWVFYLELNNYILSSIINKMTKYQQSKNPELYQKLVETTGTGYVVLDKSGRVLDANKEYVLLTGHRSLNEILGRSVIEWTASNEKNKNSEAIKECFRKGKVRGFEIDYIDKKGKITTLEINATVVEDQGKPVILTLCRDVSERRRMQNSLRQAECRLRSIVQAAPIGIGMVSKRIILQVNDLVCKMTGYSPDELIGKSARVLYPSDKEFEFVGQEKYRQINKTGLGTVETKWRRKDGSLIDVILSSSALEVKDLTQGVVFTAMDITERKNSEEELIQKNIAPGEMVKQIDFEKEKVKKEIAINVEELLIPTLKKLHSKGGSSKYVQLLEHNLKELTTSFGLKITDKKNRLTSKEIELCNMVKSGMSSKDIAELLNVSLLTISKHRRNIRKKLSISNKDVNLVSFLKTL
jgi:PAS domain S-box-containing protein